KNPPAATDIPTMPLHQRVLKLPVPTQDPKVLLKLLQLDLAAHPPQAPVKKITVEAFPARVRLAQAGLFQPLAPEPAKLEVTLARRRAAVGKKADQARQRVGFPLVTDSHRPDSFQVLLLSAEANQSGQKSKSAGRQEPERCLAAPQLVMRWFRPPLAAWVKCNTTCTTETTTPESQTRAFWGTRRHGEIKSTEQDRGAVPATVIFNGVRAFVIQASGPWRSSGAWWDHAGQWQREEWDVDLNFSSCNGASGLYRIYRDLQTGQWFVEGMYD